MRQTVPFCCAQTGASGTSHQDTTYSRVVDGMSSELVAHGGNEFHGRGIVLALSLIHI